MKTTNNLERMEYSVSPFYKMECLIHVTPKRFPWAPYDEL